MRKLPRIPILRVFRRTCIKFVFVFARYIWKNVRSLRRHCCRNGRCQLQPASGILLALAIPVFFCFPLLISLELIIQSPLNEMAKMKSNVRTRITRGIMSGPPYFYVVKPKKRVLPYPLELTDARGLVRSLRESPINSSFNAIFGRQLFSIPSVDTTTRIALKGNDSGLLPEKITSIYMKIKFSPKSVQSCNQSVTYALLILIKTNTRHRQRRMGYRRMWANRTYLATLDAPVFYAFLIGQDPDGGRHEYRLQREIDNYQDFIIGDFLDTYWNLTHKSMMGIRWAVERCPNFRYYLAVDDDIYLSVEKVLQFLEDPHRYPEAGNSTLAANESVDPMRDDYYAGRGIHATKSSFHVETSRYYLDYNEYPIEASPAYIAGFFTLFSWTTIHNFYYLSPYVKELRIDDLYIGIMADKLGIGVTFMDYLLPDQADIIRLAMESTGMNEDMKPKYNFTATCERTLAILKLLPYEEGQLFWEAHNTRNVPTSRLPSTGQRIL